MRIEKDVSATFADQLGVVGMKSHKELYEVPLIKSIKQGAQSAYSLDLVSSASRRPSIGCPK